MELISQEEGQVEEKDNAMGLTADVNKISFRSDINILKLSYIL